MDPAEDIDSGADQKKMIDTSWYYDTEDVIRRRDEVREGSDAISLQLDRVHDDYDDLSIQTNVVSLESERVDQEQHSLEKEFRYKYPGDMNSDTRDLAWAHFMLRKRLDPISPELDQLHDEYNNLSTRIDAIHLELERVEQERREVDEELEKILALDPEDPDEDLETGTDDMWNDIRRKLRAVLIDSSRLSREKDDITRRSHAITLEVSRLDQEEADLRQENAYLAEKLDDLWEKELADSDEDDEPITDDENFTEEFDDDMSLALSQRTSALCSICCTIPRGEYTQTQIPGAAYHDQTYHPSLSSLKTSVDGGCYLCEDLAENLDRFCQKSDPPATRKEFWSIRCTIECNERNSLQLNFTLCRCELGHPDGTYCEDYELLVAMKFLHSSKLSLGPEFLDPTISTSSAKSAASFAVAKSWYQKCLNHPTCRNWMRETRSLPTRLIQICGPDNGSEDLSARLCDTKGFPTSTPYVSLSHCWGTGVFFTLVQNNLEDLRRDIPIRQLPKVFQDAIYVTFKLGISYLWIDSLCIIQDSEKDWTNEAKKMGGVYLHGEFNISATAYEDGSSGLFGERMALPRKHFPLYVDCVIVDKRRYHRKYKIAFKGFFMLWNYSEFNDKVERGSLFSRAWVAQERALSPAILHYTREQMWWECNQEILSEAVPDSPYLGKIGRYLIWDDVEGSGRDRVRSLSKQSEPEQVYAFWRTFLTRHSVDRLTFQRDRFPAIAGLARILADFIDDDLIAGFWSGDLIRSLIMIRGAPQQAIQPELIAPTWSWASLCSLTRYISKEESEVKPLEGVHVIRVLSDDPGFKSDLHSTDFVQSAVRGLVIRGVLRRVPDWFHGPTGSEDWNLTSPPVSISDLEMKIDHEPGLRMLTFNVPEEQKWRLNRPAHMLLLAKGCNSAFNYKFVKGLLLQAAEIDEPITFRRIGTIEFQSEDKTPKWDEYFGLEKKDGEFQGSPWFQERGLQDIVLI